MSDSLQLKIDKIKTVFKSCPDAESKYNAIIDLGRKLPPLEESCKTENNRIAGCQSTTYVLSLCKNDSLYFLAESDALISAGLTALLILAYDGEKPEAVVQNPPLFLKELGIYDLLSPNRANGLFYIYDKMKKDATAFMNPKKP